MAGVSLLVGLTGFETATPLPPVKCATKLRYSPLALPFSAPKSPGFAPGFLPSSPAEPPPKAYTMREGACDKFILSRPGVSELTFLAPLFAHTHVDLDRGAFKTEGFAEAAGDEAAVSGIQESGGEEHEFRRPA